MFLKVLEKLTAELTEMVGFQSILASYFWTSHGRCWPRNRNSVSIQRPIDKIFQISNKIKNQKLVTGNEPPVLCALVKGVFMICSVFPVRAL